MNSDKSRPDMETLISAILMAGVVLSACLLLAGVVWRWRLTGSPRFEYALAGANLFQFWVVDIREAAGGALEPRLLVNLGIAVLMLTPYLRVLASVFYFTGVERNIKYIFFTTFVFAVLTYSLFLR